MELAIGTGIFMTACIAFGFALGYRIGRQTTEKDISRMTSYVEGGCLICHKPVVAGYDRCHEHEGYKLVPR